LPSTISSVSLGRVTSQKKFQPVPAVPDSSKKEPPVEDITLPKGRFAKRPEPEGIKTINPTRTATVCDVGVPYKGLCVARPNKPTKPKLKAMPYQSKPVATYQQNSINIFPYKRPRPFRTPNYDTL